VSAFQVFEVPLDYAPEVDSRMNHFLSYGHINIYTPSLFRFLLRSEGFDILQERQSHTDPELIRYIWYENQKKKKTWVRELILKALFLRHALKRITLGKKGYRENGFAAYTCLTQGSGDLHIF